MALTEDGQGWTPLLPRSVVGDPEACFSLRRHSRVLDEGRIDRIPGSRRAGIQMRHCGQRAIGEWAFRLNRAHTDRWPGAFIRMHRALMRATLSATRGNAECCGSGEYRSDQQPAEKKCQGCGNAALHRLRV
jgi:hypothetical protein